ncbi:NmrA/HSCARG family protein [Curtobacterium sp. MCBA15_008]|uniref:NmrA/HSCARG family protein n=1 Tax=Curtobacterium sp. MCBA15_008 TaxID=1898736 RepID=UPI0008DD519C|nr:NmrA/HSCARG family protein [Curtobacterium sp. MCBA15_008]OII09068.1 hypothetical protein BIU96_03995 [Curtobacterium sp. MCBA15_008]
MNIDTTKPFAVFGATGSQGGAVIDALLDEGRSVRALVRNATSQRAQALAARGVEVRPADATEPESVVAALQDVAGFFFMTTPAGPDGVEGETAQGVALATAAVAAGVPHVVFSSVGGADRDSGVPHFESKRRVEEYLQRQDIPTTFVRPVFFMENFLSRGISVEAGTIVVRKPYPDGIPVQMIAARDIGIVAARALVDGGLPGGELEIAGDELTGSQIARALHERTGLPARYDALPLEAVGAESDAAAMFRWFSELPAYQADFDRTRALDPDVLSFRGWLDAMDWQPPQPH